jgi:hypothetical protein
LNYRGKIGSRTIYSAKPIVVVFEGPDTLEFDTVDEVKGFLEFYNKGPSSSRNRARLYAFDAGQWVEVSN